jgi:hypothetical protein
MATDPDRLRAIARQLIDNAATSVTASEIARLHPELEDTDRAGVAALISAAVLTIAFPPFELRVVASPVWAPFDRASQVAELAAAEPRHFGSEVRDTDGVTWRRDAIRWGRALLTRPPYGRRVTFTWSDLVREFGPLTVTVEDPRAPGAGRTR